MFGMEHDFGKNYQEKRWEMVCSMKIIKVPCKIRSSVNCGAWLWRFDDVTRVTKTDILR